jgi:LuxR family maltose regulon positive regulatory protein
MNPSTLLQNQLLDAKQQLLATKFFLPTAPKTLIPRPRLNALLDNALKHPFTLVSAPAGFGKTTLLSTWAHSLAAQNTQVCWLSLDEEDNAPYLFWTYVISALQAQDPQSFGSLLFQLQSPSPPPLKSLPAQLINLLTESTSRFVLILDDYHLITEERVHTTLASLVDRLPAQLHLILATRADPPLPLPLLRAQRRAWEIRAEQLCCTTEETGAFFHQVVGIHLPDHILREVRSRTEGWLVGLQLLALSLPEHDVDPLTLLQQVSGDHHYILDYLTEVILHKQPPEVQMFLLCTSILERLGASLCDAVMEQTKSQAMLEYLERANLFIVALDSKRQWYRYHALFAQALSHQLEQNHSDLVPILHYRASRWYAQHQQTTLAILHAFQAREWQWAADLIEEAYPPLISFTWGADRYALVQLRQWVEQLPAEILASRPHLCVACVHLLWTITPHARLFMWLDLAETALKASLTEQMPAEVSQESLSVQAQQEQRDLLGKVLTLRAYLWSYLADGQTAFVLYEQALAYLSPENAAFRAIVAIGKSIASYSSSANDVVASIEYGYQAALLTQEAKQPAVTFCMMALATIHLIGAGRLREAEQLTQQALLLEIPSGDSQPPWAGWVTLCRAEVLCEWNELASAQALATEAISLCEQALSLVSLLFLTWVYTVQIHVCLSCGNLEAARAFLQQTEQIGQSMNQQVYLHLYSCFATIDRVRLWLACGELDQATRWAQKLEMKEQHLTPFARERQEVARARILLAQDQPTAALQRLELARQRATAGQRWGHVIEICLLQALAHQKLHKESQALAALSEAVRLGEPEGYLRSFVDEGEAMQALLGKLREEQRKAGPTPYLDRVLAAFPKLSQPPASQVSQAKSLAKQPVVQSLLEPLSERELQVLQLLAQGRSNQQIAQTLVIALDTVKRHVSHIFSKLGVTNRVQAVKQAHDLGLLDEVS